MSNAVKLSLAIALLVGSGMWLTYYFSSLPKPGATVAHLQPLTCAACHHSWMAEVGDPPFRCAKCSQMTGHRAAKCGNSECGAITPLVRTGPRSEAAKSPPSECYKCKGKRLIEVPVGEIP